jgi:alcohol dehydrogenase class IV
VLRHNLGAASGLYGELADLVCPGHGAEGSARADMAIGALERLAGELGLPTRLRDVGVEAHHLDLLADEAMKQERLLINNPHPIGRADARRLYEEAL